MLKLKTLISFIFVLLSFSVFSVVKNFNAGPIRGIAPHTINLDATNIHQHAKVFIWDFGNGDQVTTTSPQTNYTFKDAGTFTVTLRYLKNKQDKIDKAKDGGVTTIVVVPNKKPVPKLFCNSNVINQVECHAEGSADEDGSIVSYQYIWGDGNQFTSSNAEKIEYLYMSGGLKTISLTITDDKGGISTIEQQVNVKANNPPVANFTCSKAGIQKIHCESSSTDIESAISEYKWTLDDGATYNSSSFEHTFSRTEDVAISTHGVSLQVTDSYNESDSISKNIEVNLEPIRLAPRAYFKVFIDGTKVNLHTYITRTQFTIKRAYFNVYAQGSAVPFKTIELNEFFSNTVTKLDLAEYGNYRINLTVIDYRDQTIQISRSFSLVEDTSTLEPFVEFRVSQSAANKIYMQLNPSFDFDEFLSIKSFTINFGDGNIQEVINDTFISHQYAEAGTYTISVTAKTNHNTQKTVTREITVTADTVPIQNPDPTFVYQIYDYAQNVSFYNEKSGTPNGEIISYLWDFGDGTVGYGETQAHFYAPGTYIVSLTVTDTAGLKSTQTQKIQISTAGPDIVANIDCALMSPFVDIAQRCKVTALDRFNEISRVRVVWGDGTAFNLLNLSDINQGTYYPTKKYNDAGTFPIRLIVNTVRGETKFHDTSITLTSRPPIASLQCFPNNLMIFCNALGSYDPKGTTLSYEFDFGNGYKEENSNGVTNYAYPEAGLYTVTVKVKDATGLSSVNSTIVQAVRPPNQKPIAQLDCVSNNPLTISCNSGLSRDGDGFIVSAKYEFDDGTVETYDPNFYFNHVFTTSGNHLVKLTVTDNDGGTSSIEKNYSILENHNPLADFVCQSLNPQRIDCYSTSTDPDNGDWLVKYVWDFGDGSSEESLMGGVSHFYQSAGNFAITLTVFDQHGGTNKITKNIEVKVNQSPVVNINCVNTVGFTYQCNSNAYDPDGSIAESTWTIEGQTFSGSSALYNFTNGGEKIISFTARDNLGKFTTMNTTVSIIKPVGVLSCSKISNYKVHCDATASTGLGNDSQLSYVIIFGDDYLVEGAEGEFEFQTAGNKLIKLHVTDELGNKSETEVIINILPLYTLPNPVFVEDVEFGRVVSFDASLSLSQDRVVSRYEWDFGDGSFQESTNPKVQHTFQSYNYYNVILKVTDSKGAQSLFTKRIYIYDPQVINPEEAGRQDLLGIDSDEDGIRDDVQIWIQSEAKDNEVKRKYLRSIAIVYEDNFKNLSSPPNITLNFYKLSKLEQCVKLVELNAEKVSQINSIFRIAYGNTDNRFLALNTIDASFAGQTIDPEMSEIELKSFCEALP